VRVLLYDAMLIHMLLRFAKQNISLAPNNPSAWNYLRGVLDHNKVNYAAVKTFVEPYTKPTDPTATEVVDLDNPPPSKQAELPCVPAIEFLADVYESSDEKVQAKEVRHLFSHSNIRLSIRSSSGSRWQNSTTEFVEGRFIHSHTRFITERISDTGNIVYEKRLLTRI